MNLWTCTLFLDTAPDGHYYMDDDRFGMTDDTEGGICGYIN